MFHDISQAMLARMRELEEIDARDRTDGTPRMERLRQIRPQTGRFLALLAAGRRRGRSLRSAPAPVIPRCGWRWRRAAWAGA